jgi:hypothetical protein
MQWVTRVVRGAGERLKLEVTRTGEANALINITELGNHLEVEAPSRLVGEFQLESLTATHAGRYLGLLGQPQVGADGQPVYQADCAGKTWLIPAQLLVIALFGHSTLACDCLFTPIEPTCLAESIPRYEGRSSAFAATLQWLIADASAWRAWASVYRNALSGRFDLVCPSATARVTAHGVHIDDVFVVTKLRVVRLLASEARPSAGSTSSAASSLQTSLGAIVRRPARVRADARLASWNLESRLTDAQWSTLEPHLRMDGTRGHNKYDERDILDVIICKLATGLPWAEMPRERRLVGSAQARYRLLKRSSFIDKAVDVLC